MSAATIACLKITLDDVQPTVLRRMDVPFSIRLDRLHLALQAALGWSNDHLYEFRSRDVGWGIPDPTWRDGPLDARKARLDVVIQDLGTKTLKYLYDFGDGWTHTVRIERLADAIPSLIYPYLADGCGRCPPKDIGGPPGYADFLDAIADPKRERRAEILEWADPDFDPNLMDIAAHRDAVGALARKWAPKPRATPTETQNCGLRRRLAFGRADGLHRTHPPTHAYAL